MSGKSLELWIKKSVRTWYLCCRIIKSQSLKMFVVNHIAFKLCNCMTITLLTDDWIIPLERLPKKLRTPLHHTVLKNIFLWEKTCKPWQWRLYLWQEIHKLGSAYDMVRIQVPRILQKLYWEYNISFSSY